MPLNPPQEHLLILEKEKHQKGDKYQVDDHLDQASKGRYGYLDDILAEIVEFRCQQGDKLVDLRLGEYSRKSLRKEEQVCLYSCPIVGRS
jgi:hypothetical protein